MRSPSGTFCRRAPPCVQFASVSLDAFPPFGRERTSTPLTGARRYRELQRGVLGDCPRLSEEEPEHPRLSTGEIDHNFDSQVLSDWSRDRRSSLDLVQSVVLMCGLIYGEMNPTLATAYSPTVACLLYVDPLLFQRMYIGCCLPVDFIFPDCCSTACSLTAALLRLPGDCRRPRGGTGQAHGGGGRAAGYEASHGSCAVPARGW